MLLGTAGEDLSIRRPWMSSSPRSYGAVPVQVFTRGPALTCSGAVGRTLGVAGMLAAPPERFPLSRSPFDVAI